MDQGNDDTCLLCYKPFSYTERGREYNLGNNLMLRPLEVLDRVHHCLYCLLNKTDLIQERRKITEKKQDNIVKKRRRVKCVECGFIGFYYTNTCYDCIKLVPRLNILIHGTSQPDKHITFNMI